MDAFANDRYVLDVSANLTSGLNSCSFGPKLLSGRGSAWKEVAKPCGTCPTHCNYRVLDTEINAPHFNESVLVPETLTKSIGYCKLVTKSDAFFKSLVALNGQPKFKNGKPSGYLLDRGTSNSKDTCLYFKGTYK